jgi:hypothetical protein
MLKTLLCQKIDLQGRKTPPKTPKFLIFSVVKIKAGKKYVGKIIFSMDVIGWMREEFAHGGGTYIQSRLHEKNTPEVWGPKSKYTLRSITSKWHEKLEHIWGQNERPDTISGSRGPPTPFFTVF